MLYIDFVFTLLSFIFFIQSISSSKKFLKNKDPRIYAAVKGRNGTVRVFFVMTCIKLFVGAALVIALINFLLSEMRETDALYVVVYSVLSGGLTIISFILGIEAQKKFRQAKNTYDCLVPLPTQTAFIGNPNSTNYYSANKQGGYQQNMYTNNPTQLHSFTSDQTPFEAPPNYNDYNYGNTSSGYMQPKTNAAPYNNQQYGQQKSFIQPESSTANYSKPPVNDFTSVKKSETKQYVSQMPEVKPFSETRSAVTASTPENITVVPQSSAAYGVKPKETVRCKHCGVSNKAGDKFCTFCGKNLSE